MMPAGGGGMRRKEESCGRPWLARTFLLCMSARMGGRDFVRYKTPGQSSIHTYIHTYIRVEPPPGLTDEAE